MSRNTEITGSEALILSLLEEGVDTIFGYPGGAIMPVYDALYDYSHRLEHILVRHEQGAAHAAEGYARISGRPGVCLVTSGPGATNLITGIANAMVDSVPLVCISGQVAGPLLGSDAFQETDVIGISMPVTKWNYQVNRADEIAGVIAKAFYIAATGRPGPVLIDITKDAQFEKVHFEYKKCTRIRSYFPFPKVKTDDIERAAVLINKAKKPLILAGHGILLSGAEDELLELAEKADIPVASTLMGLSAFPVSHRLYAGMLGMHGNYGPNINTNECDLLIAIGMRFDDRITGNLKEYARQADVIHFEIDQSEVNKNVYANVAVVGDAGDSLRQIIPLVNKNEHKSWLQSFRDLNGVEYDRITRPRASGKVENICMDEVVHLVSELTRGEAVIVSDVGQNQMVSARNYKFRNANTWVTSGGLGTMGFGLPAAIGAEIADRNKMVIAIAGDGGFQMTIQELGTLVQCGLKLKIIVLNNSFLGMVRQWQDMFFKKRYSFTSISSPDFLLIGKAYGISGLRVEKREDLAVAVQSMVDSEGPFILEVLVEKEDMVFPMIPTGVSVSGMRLE